MLCHIIVEGSLTTTAQTITASVHLRMKGESMPANAAIYYEPDGFTTQRSNLMGRHAATESFLQGFVRHAGVDRFYCYAKAEAMMRPFMQQVRALDAKTPAAWLPFADPVAPATVGCVMRYDAALDGLAWRRRRIGQRHYSLCGVTHTTAGGGLDPIMAMLTAPLQEWDALICTSQVVRDTVERVHEEEKEYLAARIGATRFSGPMLPIIPLGITVEDYQPPAGARARWRQKLGIGADDVVFLFVGRLSFHAKANPLPMYLALERVAAQTGRRLHLIQAGWFANEALEKAFRSSAAALCPSVNALFVDGRPPEVRREIWAAADIFTSLSDNVQETFGLTPIEAMAAGLPLVVTDWNGYRDTVRDGVDGFRIPTLMPPAPLGADLADGLTSGIDSYDRFCGYTSQLVGVDTEATTTAFNHLVTNPALRRSMGDSGRTRARALYDWSSIIPRYQALWEELAERRRTVPEVAPLRPGREPYPARPDPFAAFATYPTSLIGLDHVVALGETADAATLRVRLASPLVEFARPRMLRSGIAEAVLHHLGRHGPCPARALLSLAPSGYEAELVRGLVWLHKLALLRIQPPIQDVVGGMTLNDITRAAGTETNSTGESPAERGRNGP